MIAKGRGILYFDTIVDRNNYTPITGDASIVSVVETSAIYKYDFIKGIWKENGNSFPYDLIYDATPINSNYTLISSDKNKNKIISSDITITLAETNMGGLSIGDIFVLEMQTGVTVNITSSNNISISNITYSNNYRSIFIVLDGTPYGFPVGTLFPFKIGGFYTSVDTPNSSESKNVSSFNSNYTIQNTDYFVEISAAGSVATLPTAVGITGQTFVIKNTSSGDIDLNTTNSETIHSITADTTITIAPGNAVSVYSDGSLTLYGSTLTDYKTL